MRDLEVKAWNALTTQQQEELTLDGANHGKKVITIFEGQFAASNNMDIKWRNFGFM
jgi:hypothetical protein